MRWRLPCASLVMVLASGCGGGDDTAVSGAPPVASPPPAPAPGPSPAPTPSPAPVPPPAPAPGPVTVDGARLAAAFCKDTQARHGAPLVGAFPIGLTQPDPYIFATMTQQICRPTAAPPFYSFTSSRYLGNPAVTFPSIQVLAPMPSTQAPFELGTTLTVRLVFDGPVIEEHAMTAATAYVLTDAEPVELGRTLHTWRADDPSRPGKVDLLVLDHPSTADHPAAMFKVCWQVTVPTWSRRSCQVHTRADGAFAGIEITDSSYPRDPVTWFGWWEGTPF